MKNLLPFVFAFCLAFFSNPVFTAPAKAADLRDEEAFTQEYMQASGIPDGATVNIHMAAWLGDTFYAYLDNSSIYTWKPGNQTPALFCKLPEPPHEAYLSYEKITAENKKILDGTVSYITAGDGALWGYNVFSGKVGRITKEGVNWQAVQLDVSRLYPNAAAYPLRIAYSFVENGGLFLLVSLDSGGITDALEYELLRYDLTSGRYTVLDTQGAQGICQYIPGSLLMLRITQDRYRLSIMNLSTRELADLPDSLSAFNKNSFLGGLAYDASSDSVYITFGNQVFASKKGTPFKAVAFVPANGIMAETQAWILPDGRYAIFNGGIYIREAHEQLSQKSLRIKAGYINQTIYADFAKEYPDIPVSISHTLATASDISESVRTGNADADLYQITLDYAFTALVNKGYAAEMSTSEIIQTDVQRMYPFVQRLITNEKNQPVAYPVNMWLGQLYVNKGFWKLAFGDEPLPATYDQFMDDMLLWETDYADDYPDIEFVMNFDHAYWVKQIIQDYVQQYEQEGKLLDLNDPALVNVLEKLEKVCEARKASNRSTTFVSMDEWGEKSQIFDLQMTGTFLSNTKRASLSYRSAFLYDVNPYDVTPCFLTFKTNETAKTRALVQVWVINPISPNRDAALRFVEYAARVKNNPYVCYAVHPDLNEPYEDPNFELQIKAMKKNQADLKEALKTAEGTDRMDLEDNLKYTENWLDGQENERWMITPESVANYRRIAPSLDFFENSLYLGASGNPVQVQMEKVIARYAGGQLSLNLLIDELNKMMKMVSIENE